LAFYDNPSPKLPVSNATGPASRSRRGQNPLSGWLFYDNPRPESSVSNTTGEFVFLIASNGSVSKSRPGETDDRVVSGTVRNCGAVMAGAGFPLVGPRNPLSAWLFYDHPKPESPVQTHAPGRVQLMAALHDLRGCSFPTSLAKLVRAKPSAGCEDVTPFHSSVEPREVDIGCLVAVVSCAGLNSHALSRPPIYRLRSCGAAGSQQQITVMLAANPGWRLAMSACNLWDERRQRWCSARR
jgi:hypothetical protein